MRYYTILFLISICSFLRSNAQSLAESRTKSYYTYIYKLSDDDIPAITAYKFDFNSLLTKQAVDSFL
ncbi:MAG: hypothetical protein WCO63_15620 [Bacteroidota bacterium]